MLATLDRVPDLTSSLRAAPPELKRLVFDAFRVQVRYDRVDGRIEIGATVSEAVANAFVKSGDVRSPNPGMEPTPLEDTRRPHLRVATAARLPI